MLYKNYFRVLSEAQGAYCDFCYNIAVKLNNKKRITEWEWYRVMLLWAKFYQAIKWKELNTDLQLNKCMQDIEELSNINSFPFVPVPLTSINFPRIVSGDPVSMTGEPGPAGLNANIDCVVDPDVVELDEFQLSIRSDVVDLLKTFYFSLVQYLQPTVALSVEADDGRVVLEVGESKQILVSRSITVNSEDHPIVSKSYTAPGSAPDITAETEDSFLTAGVLKTSPTTLTFTTEVADDKTTINKSDTMIWRYPILYGASANGAVNLYTLTKLSTGNNLDTYGDTPIAFNDTDKYFYFSYPEEYPDLEKIFDGNPVGDDVLSAFTKTVVSVTSTGLDSNWTHNYKRYRTNNITDIVATYLFLFA